MVTDAVILAYTAGLIDGEGHIGCSVAQPGGARRTPSFRIRAKIAMCDREPVGGLIIPSNCAIQPIRKRHNLLG